MKLISRFLNFGSSPRVKNDQITQLQSTVTEKSTENEKLRLKLEQLDKQAKDLQVLYLLQGGVAITPDFWGFITPDKWGCSIFR